MEKKNHKLVLVSEITASENVAVSSLWSEKNTYYPHSIG